MISHLKIKNFKSIRDLSLDCKRVNVFIGEPNTGKSNILESLGILSFNYHGYYGDDAKRFVRFGNTSNLSYDEILDEEIEIHCDSTSLSLKFENGRFMGQALDGTLRRAG